MIQSSCVWPGSESRPFLCIGTGPPGLIDGSCPGVWSSPYSQSFLSWSCLERLWPEFLRFGCTGGSSTYFIEILLSIRGTRCVGRTSSSFHSGLFSKRQHCHKFFLLILVWAALRVVCGNDFVISSSAVALHTSVSVNHGFRLPERRLQLPSNPGFIAGAIDSSTVASTSSVDGSCGPAPLGTASAADPEGVAKDGSVHSAGSLHDRVGIGTLTPPCDPGFIHTTSGLVRLCDGHTINLASVDVALKDTIRSVGLRPLLEYPSQSTTDALYSVGWFCFFRRIKSAIKHAGFGLSTTRAFKKGEALGVYSGVCVSEGVSNGYVARASYNPSVYVDGTPVWGSRIGHTCFGYINDNYRHPDKYNCKLIKHNVIQTLRDIKKGEELFMSYSENNWDHMKVATLRFLVLGVRGVAQLLHIEYFDEIEFLSDHVAKLQQGDLCGMRSGSMVEKLLIGSIDGFLKSGDLITEFDEVVHRVQPSAQYETETFLNWLERLLRCRSFHSQVVFQSWDASKKWDFSAFSKLLEREIKPGSRTTRCYKFMGETDDCILTPLRYTSPAESSDLCFAGKAIVASEG